jgi:NADH:ubiquinone oxidoreductase subunit E
VKESKGQLMNVIEPYAGRPEELIQALHGVQEGLGHVPLDAQRLVAETLGVPLSRVYGVVTFYHFFRTRPVGRHTIRQCLGTACHVRGAENVLRALQETLDVDIGDTSADGLFTLEVVRCLGTCSLAPVMMVDETVHGRLNAETVREVIQIYRGDGEE